jgi:hypothetical protein
VYPLPRRQKVRQSRGAGARTQFEFALELNQMQTGNAVMTKSTFTVMP